MSDRTQNISFNPNKPEDYKTEKGAPAPRKTKKDFKKILAKEEQGDERKSKNREFSDNPRTEDADTAYEDVELKLEAYDQKPKVKSASLFDIASEPVKKGENVKTEEAASTSEEFTSGEIPEELQEETLSALFKGYGTKEKLAMIQKEVKGLPDQPVDAHIDALRGNEAIAGALDENKANFPENRSQTPQDDLRKPVEVTSTGNEQTDAFPREQADLAAINPIAGGAAASTTTVSQAQGVQHTPVRAQELQEIVDQIVSKLYTLSSEGKTDTLIKLKHPPLFAGSSVVIRSFDSAKGEFNITFENLTQAAKQMLDMQENQNSLRFALEQKGYTVHILTATTQSEITQLAEGQGLERERQDQEDDSSRERQKQEQEEETT